MIKITADNGKFKAEGTFNFGYIGLYRSEQIQIIESSDEIRHWETAGKALDTGSCTDDDIAAFLTGYINALENKIQSNIKQVNDNFLLRVFEDMESCGAEFWECDELTVTAAMPADPENDIYQPNYDTMSELEAEYRGSPNDGSVRKTDAEAVLRKLFPMFGWDGLINGIVPESICISDGNISFQCSDKYDTAVLCGAYDCLDKELRFTDWHNF